MMKTKLFKYLIAICLPLNVVGQNAVGFKITGHLDGLADGEMVKLFNRFGDWHIPKWMDSCRVVNGEFHLQSLVQVDGGPRQYEIDFEKRSDRWTRGCALLIDNGDKISIKGGDINKIDHMQITDEIDIEGSQSNYARNLLLPLFSNFGKSVGIIDDRLNKIRDSIGFDRPLVQSQIEGKAAVVQKLATALQNIQKTELAIPYMMAGMDNKYCHEAYVAELYNKLDNRIRSSYYGKQMKIYASLSVGQKMPGFNLPTPEGKLISLQDFVAKNKMTIVHFWGSSSWQREKHQHELKVLYKKYHQKGLDIIGVSADSVAAKWKDMVDEEEFPWIDVSDLKGNFQGGIVNDVYNEGGHSMPNTTNVLLDHEGKIIAWDVDGVELQWYLWKYLDN